jgi:AcrR family transcriptional regulator
MAEPTADAESDSSPGRRIRGLDAEQRRSQRRAQLLDAALDQFARDGYHQTSIEQICRAAIVSTKSFYESFGSREECYIALLRRTTEQISGLMVEGLEGTSGDEESVSRELISAFAHALVDDPRLAKVTFGEAAGISPGVEQQRRINRRWAASFLEEVWRHFGVIDAATAAEPVDAHSVAIGAVGGLFDVVADWLHDADPADADAVDELIRRLTVFYRTLRAGLTPAAAAT